MKTLKDLRESCLISPQLMENFISRNLASLVLVGAQKELEPLQQLHPHVGTWYNQRDWFNRAKKEYLELCERHFSGLFATYKHSCSLDSGYDANQVWKTIMWEVDKMLYEFAKV